MAVTEEKPEKGFFGLFKKKAEEPPPAAAVVAPKEGPTQAIPAMVPLFITVLEEKLPIRVMLGDTPFWYYSHFEWELLESESGFVVESRAYLEESKFLLLAPLDPPIGNLKIRNAKEVHLELTSKYHLLECTTTLEQITPARKIRLVFPRSMRQKPQQRLAVRVPVARNMPIVASVIRPSGIVFEAQFRDISSGGSAFCATGAIPKIADHARVTMAITYPDGKLEVEAVVVGSFPKDGEHIFRSQFLVADQQTSRDINALVSYVQRENIQRRKRTLQ
ncbi:MAG: PilZ domain-containing protein [Magnetococcales bacterium]|nr:PilZ domain-containing protein [Magnetococcales bacterium]